MQNEYLPKQKEIVDSWAAKRDEILLEHSTLKKDGETLLDINLKLAESNKDIETNINKLLGRAEEVERSVKSSEEFISKEIGRLNVEKTELENRIYTLKTEISYLVEIKETATKDIALLNETSAAITAKDAVIEKIVQHVSEVNSTNMNKFLSFIDSFETKAKEILTLSTLNIEAHNKILNEIPILFVELRRKSLEREVLPINIKKDE